MKFLYNIIAKAYDKNIDASGVSLFRIFYCIILLFEVIQLFYFRHLVFDKIPFLEVAEIDFTIPLIGWMITIVFLIFGLFTRQASIINYIFSIVFISTISTYEYHMFYVYMSVNFLMIFVNLSQVYSLDRLLVKLKFSNTRFNYIPSRQVNVINYYIIVLVAIGFFYFDSVLFKLTSYTWMNGLGLWLPASLPPLVHANLSFLLNIKWLAIGLGYITLLFEALFIFLFWSKRLRGLFFIIGTALHIGIVIIFPIPWFGLGVCALYLLLVPTHYWKSIGNAIKLKSPLLVFYYDEECPLCNRTKIILTHFDVLNAISFKGVQTYGFDNPALSSYSKDELLDNIFSITHTGKVLQGVDTYRYAFKKIPAFFIVGIAMSIPGIYHFAKWVYKLIARNRYVERCTEDNCGYIAPSRPIDIDQIKVLSNVTIGKVKIVLITVSFILICLLQLNVAYNSALVKNARKATGIYNSGAEKIFQSIANPTRYLSKVLLGIGSHALFMDEHFRGYNHVIAIESEDKNGKKRWLPIINEKGMPGIYNYGFIWAKSTFRFNSPNIKQEVLVRGVRDFTAFWATKNGVDVKELKFNLYVKKQDIPSEWQADYLNMQMQHEWKLVGSLFWDNDDFISDVPIIEDLR